MSIRPVLAATRRTDATGGRSRESGANFFDTPVAKRAMASCECAVLNVRPRGDSHFSDTPHRRTHGFGKSKAGAGGKRAKPHLMRSSEIDATGIALLPTGPDVGCVKSPQISRSAPRSPAGRCRFSTENVTFFAASGSLSVAERADTRTFTRGRPAVCPRTRPAAVAQAGHPRPGPRGRARFSGEGRFRQPVELTGPAADDSSAPPLRIQACRRPGARSGGQS